MYWKIIRWGATAAVILLLIAAAVLSPSAPTAQTSEEGTSPAAPTAEPVTDQPSKKFNL